MQLKFFPYLSFVIGFAMEKLHYTVELIYCNVTIYCIIWKTCCSRFPVIIIVCCYIVCLYCLVVAYGLFLKISNLIWDSGHPGLHLYCIYCLYFSEYAVINVRTRQVATVKSGLTSIASHLGKVLPYLTLKAYLLQCERCS